MKRSEINKALKEMEQMVEKHGFELPPFCKWTKEEWENKGHEYDEIRDNGLGWDITDFGMGDFTKNGFGLFTVRNGNQKMNKYVKPYAEKLLMMYPGQKAAMHFHWSKMEDIINRGGNDVYITDLESSNGTLVNGVRLNRRRKLLPNDEITAGNIQAKIVW